MALDKTTAQDDLAFLRRLMSGDADGAAQRAFGYVYALWGLAFAVPIFVQWTGFMGWLKLPDWYWLAAATIVTVVLIVVTIVAMRGSRPMVGVQSKAWRSVFAGVGLANLAVLVGLSLASAHLKDDRVMMLHAVVVFAFQGAAWFVVWSLRKQAWTGLVAGGWFVFAAALGATIPGSNFILLCAVGLTLLMVAPGLALARAAPKGD